jgi:Na+-transporting methylmalonyl-CoA/oxaloacetate decarboxylase gamma subunit
MRKRGMGTQELVVMGIIIVLIVLVILYLVGRSTTIARSTEKCDDTAGETCVPASSCEGTALPFKKCTTGNVCCKVVTT